MNVANSAGSQAVCEAPEAAARSRGRVLKRWKSSLFQAAMRAHLRRALWFHRLARRLYEPVKINGRIHAGQRSSDDRWQAIVAVLKANAAKNVLDIGCAEGWFVRRAATELGCYAVGVEASERLVGGEIARLHDKVENTAIMLSRASDASIRNLPKFDVVICLSVVHHVIRRQGIGAARDFVRALASRAEKAVIFEMGTSEEADLKWRGLLEDMPSGQEVYVTQFLQTCGLRNIRLIACSSAFHGNASRLMFSCAPPPSS